MLRKIALGVAAVLTLILIVAATRPDTFRIERSAMVQAPPEEIYPLVSDFRGWSEWSPFDRLDPDMVRIFSGAQRGEGAVYAWSGNAKAGKGRMRIVEANAPERVRIQLVFEKPFRSENTAEFTFEPVGQSTRVTWAMYGPSSYVSKVFGLFVDMDGMVGKDFEAGLANLKALAER